MKHFDFKVMNGSFGFLFGNRFHKHPDRKVGIYFAIRNKTKSRSLTFFFAPLFWLAAIYERPGIVDRHEIEFFDGAIKFWKG